MLEEKIEELTVAINRLIGVMAPAVSLAVQETEKPAARKPGRPKKAPEPVAAIPEPEPEPQPFVGPPAPEPEPAPTWTYDDIQNKAVDISRILGPNFDRMGRLMADHNVERLPDLKPEQFASFMSGLDKLEEEFRK